MNVAYDIDNLCVPHACPARGGWWPGEKPGTPTAAENLWSTNLSFNPTAGLLMCADQQF